MKYSLKPIDSEFLEFAYYYDEVLINTPFGRYSDYIFERVCQTRDKYLKTAYGKGKIPQALKNVEYVCLDNKIIIPPNCAWLSKSGRFSCLWMDYYLVYQSYILWDNFRRVPMPIIFNDLNGIDEENGTIFCRTPIPPLDRRGLADPTIVNLDWIELYGYPSPESDEYPKGIKHNYSQFELYEIALKYQESVNNPNDLQRTIMQNYPQDFDDL
ncbi:MAG: hypothetical protein K9H49_10935 [Bacteroidales bacterium]|nr:hypothetical protein [Bacteroidales bacterium]